MNGNSPGSLSRESETLHHLEACLDPCVECDHRMNLDGACCQEVLSVFVTVDEESHIRDTVNIVCPCLDHHLPSTLVNIDNGSWLGEDSIESMEVKLKEWWHNQRHMRVLRLIEPESMVNQGR